jgi:hypothetical protein
MEQAEQNVIGTGTETGTRTNRKNSEIEDTQEDGKKTKEI